MLKTICDNCHVEIPPGAAAGAFEDNDQKLGRFDRWDLCRHCTTRARNALRAQPLPPRAGLSVDGVDVAGDKRSIEAVSAWRHDSVEVVPGLRAELEQLRKQRAEGSW